MKVQLPFIFLVIMQLALFKPVMAAEDKPVENLPRLIDTALANNPELKASDARWRMFREKVARPAPWTTR